ncbi:cytochrome c [Ramlibacter monticola]|uniref:Cytochrome c n=1 Tax=Ramlibacter monticola TaxID=1926872 RepID=A0A936Z5A7_9BURK|nr:cytochrome c [Ramlibacter monticola]MBL0393985.1 cytochrome c [Ramlibacter monticola]
MKKLCITLAALAAGIASAQDNPEVEGKRLFTSGTPACILCHTLRDAGAEGAIGPSLDELKPDAARVAKAMKTGIGQMPAFSQLSDAQVQAVARYVEAASRR